MLLLAMPVWCTQKGQPFHLFTTTKLLLASDLSTLLVQIRPEGFWPPGFNSSFNNQNAMLIGLTLGKSQETLKLACNGDGKAV